MLQLLSPVYSAVMQLRNTLYDLGVLDAFYLGARTISVGNLTTGGTGKTPLTAYIAKLLLERGERVCILSRGYGREDENTRVLVADGTDVLADAKQGGDEPVEIAQKLAGRAIVIADADRVAAADWAMRKFSPTVFVLDDAFQHRRAKRDLDIVCIDAADPFGGGQMLPAGRLREPLDNLSRSDAVVVIGKASPDLDGQIIAAAAPDAAVFHARKKIAYIRDAEGQTFDTSNKRLFAFCGLARPDSFFELLQSHGVDVIGTKTFRDHYSYTQTDLADLQSLAKSSGADAVITTAKDAVKLDRPHLSINCLVAELELEIDDAAEFAAML